MHDERTQAALAGRYEIRMGDWVSRGWDLFIANWGPYVLFALLYVLISVLGRGLVNFIIGAHLTAGFFIVALKQSRGERTSFGDFWKAFELFLPFFLAGLVSWLLTVAGLILCILPGIYLAVAYLLVAPILWDRRCDFWDAMELSRQVATRHWFSWFVFALLLVAINIVGLLLCLAGLLATIPISLCALAAAYEDILGRAPALAATPSAPPWTPPSPPNPSPTDPAPVAP